MRLSMLFKRTHPVYINPAVISFGPSANNHAFYNNWLAYQLLASLSLQRLLIWCTTQSWNSIP